MSLTLTGAGAGSESASYSTRVLATPGLISYWRLDEPSGVSAADSKSTNTGTYSGTVTLGSAGAVAGSTAMAVAGAGAFSAPVNLSALAVVTIECWLKWTAFANDDKIAIEYTVNSGIANDGFLIDPNGSGTTLWDLSMHNAGGFNATSYNRPSAGVYHHIAAIFDRTKTAVAGAGVLYIDGVLQTPASNNGGGAMGGNFANSTLYGMSRATTSLFATGSLDELAIYSGALSAATILDHAAG